eukprot:g49673.t1
MAITQGAGQNGPTQKGRRRDCRTGFPLGTHSAQAPLMPHAQEQHGSLPSYLATPSTIATTNSLRIQSISSPTGAKTEKSPYTAEAPDARLIEIEEGEGDSNMLLQGNSEILTRLTGSA